MQKLTIKTALQKIDIEILGALAVIAGAIFLIISYVNNPSQPSYKGSDKQDIILLEEAPQPHSEPITVKSVGEKTGKVVTEFSISVGKGAWKAVWGDKKETEEKE